MTFDTIAVLGGGAWGTALANCAARAGRRVRVWAREAATAEAINARRESPRLPGVKIDPRVSATTVLEEAMRADAALLVVPAQASRAVATAIPAAQAIPIVACAKGIERGSH